MTDEQFDRLMTAVLELGRRLDTLEQRFDTFEAKMDARLDKLEVLLRRHIMEDHAALER